jgi:hypothetical protein
MNAIGNSDFAGVLKHSGLKKGFDDEEGVELGRPLLSGFDSAESGGVKAPADEKIPVQVRGGSFREFN